MTLRRGDRVKETTVTTGTGTYTLAGAATGYQAFSAIPSIIDTDTVEYCVTDGTDWEVGLGTYTSGSIARTSVYASSNGGAAVNWSAGDKDIFNDIPARFFTRSAVLGGETVTASNPILDLSQTWNNGAVQFTGLKLNITNTASPHSYLMDLQLDGTTKFNVDKQGNVAPNYIVFTNPVFSPVSGLLANGAISSDASGGINFYIGNSSLLYGANLSSAAKFTVGQAGVTNGSLAIVTGANTITINGNSSSGYNFNLPTTAGSAGEVLTSQGGGATAMTWAATPAASLTVGTTTIASGTTTRILYDNAGVLGEYTLTGTGTVVAMATSPSLTTPALGVATATSLAIGGATIGTDGLAITGTMTVSGLETAAGFAPSSSTATGNRLYLPAANTLGLAINGTGTLQLTASVFSPVTNDISALGSGTLMWSDLFLASGSVINWNNSDLTLTHSSNVLTLAGGDIVLGANRVMGTLTSGQQAPTGNFYVDGSVSTGTGVGAQSNATALQLKGSTNMQARVFVSGNNATVLTANVAYASQIIGANVITEGTSGTHALLSQLAVRPVVVTGGTATVTNTATVYIEDAITATVTGANYALWVDAGDVQIDANAVVGGTLSVGGKNPILAVTKQVFTANGTYTPTTGMTYCIVECVGGGGGGGAANGALTYGYGAGGGQSGGYARSVLTAATVGASLAVAIGAGGAGGTTADNDGSTGADTTLGTTVVVAKGGAGGVGINTTKTGAGGFSSTTGTGDEAPAGMAGHAGIITSSTVSYGPSGGGGSSRLGPGAPSVVSTTADTVGTAGGANTGGGGSGGSVYNSANDAAGGAGGSGKMIIWEYLKV